MACRIGSDNPQRLGRENAMGFLRCRGHDVLLIEHPDRQGGRVGAMTGNVDTAGRHVQLRGRSGRKR